MTQCKATTNFGPRCANKAQFGDYCRIHSREAVEIRERERAIAAAKEKVLRLFARAHKLRLEYLDREGVNNPEEITSMVEARVAVDELIALGWEPEK